MDHLVSNLHANPYWVYLMRVNKVLFYFTATKKVTVLWTFRYHHSITQSRWVFTLNKTNIQPRSLTCSETHCGDWVLVGGMLAIIASIYQTPGQCHHFKWQHPMVQLLTRPLSAVLSCRVLGALCWKSSRGKREANSGGLEFDLMLPQSQRLQDSSSEVKDKAIQCSLAVRK